MANISGVFGTMSIEGDWTPTMIKNLNTIKEEWSKWHYSIEVDNFESIGVAVSFTADGRWCFDTNLKQIGIWTKDTEKENVKTAYEELCNELKSKVDEGGNVTALINLTFTEEEGGCQILRKAESEIIYCDGEIKGVTISEENYDYTKENLVKLGIYDSIEDIDWMDEDEEERLNIND